MSLIKWDPFRDADEGFSRLLPSMFGRWPRSAIDSGSKFEWTPSADISETDTEYLIRAELPAVKKEDVKVTIDQGMITIQGERKQEREAKGEKYHRMESLHGAFARSFSLPDNVDETTIRADSKDGVLTVHLPKTKVEKAKAVEVRIQ
jgi:HSP20 family protein